MSNNEARSLPPLFQSSFTSLPVENSALRNFPEPADANYVLAQYFGGRLLVPVSILKLQSVCLRASGDERVRLFEKRLHNLFEAAERKGIEPF